jgi:hypothetical protein
MPKKDTVNQENGGEKSVKPRVPKKKKAFSFDEFMERVNERRERARRRIMKISENIGEKIDRLLRGEPEEKPKPASKSVKKGDEDAES